MNRILIAIFTLCLCACGGKSSNNRFQAYSAQHKGAAYSEARHDGVAYIYDYDSLAKMAGSSSHDPALHEVEWELLAAGYKDELLHVVPNLRASLKIGATDGVISSVSGFDGCNRFWGNAEEMEGTLTFTDVTSTLAGCLFGNNPSGDAFKANETPGIGEFRGEQHNTFHRVIRDVHQYRVEQGLLTLVSSQGEFLVLKPASPPVDVAPQ